MYEIVYGIVYGFGDGSVGNAVAGGIDDLANDAVDTLYYKWGRKPILRSNATMRKSW